MWAIHALVFNMFVSNLFTINHFPPVFKRCQVEDDRREAFIIQILLCICIFICISCSTERFDAKRINETINFFFFFFSLIDFDEWPTMSLWQYSFLIIIFTVRYLYHQETIFSYQSIKIIVQSISIQIS
jgi:predicted membrane-bound dolichyl-phosphate-mannose-protein mannosyltransferase